MNKFIFLILCWTAVQTTFAENPSWYPDNAQELIDKCRNETMSATGCIRLKYHAYFLCGAKALNVYSEESGLNVERFTYTYFEPSNKLDCLIPIVQNCADENKETTSKGKMLLDIFECTLEKKNEIEENC